jgi:hypothetical protein
MAIAPPGQQSSTIMDLKRNLSEEATLVFQAILAAAGFVGGMFAADNPVREVLYPLANNCPQGGCPTPITDQGYLFEWKGVPAYGLTAFDPTGQLAYEVNITAPDGSPAHIRSHGSDITVDSDGRVLLAIWFGEPGHLKGSGLVMLDATGKQVQFVDTGRFVPDAACFGPDHSIWVIGTQYAPPDGSVFVSGIQNSVDHRQTADYNLVRKYSPDGKLVGSFLPRSLFPSGLPPGAAGWMKSSSDKIGIMAYPGKVANDPEWIELDFEGKLLGRWKLGPSYGVQHYMGGFAFTAEGRLFAETVTCPLRVQCSYRLEFLDRATSSWVPTNENPLDRFRVPLGADKDKIVVWERSPDSTGVRLLWVTPR